MRVEESRCGETECQSEGQTEEKNATIRVKVKVEREEGHEKQGTHDGTAGGATQNGELAAMDEECGHSWPANEDDDTHTHAMGDPSPPQTHADTLPVSISTETPAPPQRPRLRRWWPNKQLTLLNSGTLLSTHAGTHSHTHPPPAPPSEKTLGALRGGFPSLGFRGFQGGLWGHHRSRGGQWSQRLSQQVWGRGKRRFPCGFCEKSFDRLSHLDRHRRIHTGERPYGCPVCGRRFTQKSSLKGHLRTHRGQLRDWKFHSVCVYVRVRVCVRVSVYVRVCVCVCVCVCWSVRAQRIQMSI